MPNWKMRAKRARRRHADDQALQDAEPRLDLHDAHELEHEVDGHHAVGIEQHREVVVLAPALAEIADIAGLEADIVGAPPVGQRDPSAPECRQRRKARILGGGDGALAGVAQHIDMEALADAARGEPREHRLEQAGGAVGRLVADAEQDRGRRGDRLVAAHAAGDRRDRRHRIARKAHDQQADGRVPEPDHVPGQRYREQHDQNEIDNAEAAGRERDDGEPDQAGDRQPDGEKEQDRPPGGQGRQARRLRPRRGGSVRACRGFACLFWRFEDIAA